MRGLGGRGRRVEQLKNALGAGHRRLQDVVFLGKILDRTEYPRAVLHEGHHRAERQTAFDYPLAAEENQHGQSRDADELDRRIEKRVRADGLVVGLTVLLVDGGELVERCLLMIEQLNL